MLRCLLVALLGALSVAGQSLPENQGKTLRLVIAGLVHGHVDGFLRSASKRQDVQIVGLYDPDATLRQKYATKYQLPEKALFADLGKMIDQTHPDAVATFTSTFDHPMVVEMAAAKHVPVMMEKPLAVSLAHAERIRKAAASSGIPVIVNYETTWYASHGAMWTLMKEKKAAGGIRKMVAMDGHQGPKEIGTGPEFFTWLTDPVKNGAGALFDFGCYGANLMTWMMDNQRPISVRALTQQDKPQIYPKVDDEATILLEYPKAQGIIQGSWNWPYSRKDFEVYGESGYAIAIGGNLLRVRTGSAKEEDAQKPEELPAATHDSISYLRSVVFDKMKPEGLSSLENNLIVTEILDAARESARTGRAVKLAHK